MVFLTLLLLGNKLNLFSVFSIVMATGETHNTLGIEEIC